MFKIGVPEAVVIIMAFGPTVGALGTLIYYVRKRSKKDK